MQNHMEFSKKTWRYTMVDPYGNLSTIERNIPPTTVSWEYICPVSYTHLTLPTNREV